MESLGSARAVNRFLILSAAVQWLDLISRVAGSGQYRGWVLS
jgi:hypothetical protein